MTRRSWLRTLFGPKSGPRPARPRPRPRTRLAVEPLEDRLAPATLTVTSGADDAALALDSLRSAVASVEKGADVNANIQRTGTYGTNDIILFDLPAGQRTITLTTNDNNLAFGPTGLVVTSTMTIEATQDGVTISGNDARRLFAVASTATLTLQGLTLTGGLAQGGAGGSVLAGDGGGGGGGAGLGGAVFNAGTLDLLACTLAGNAAAGGQGGTPGNGGLNGGNGLAGAGGGGSAGFKGGDFDGTNNGNAGGGGIGGPGGNNLPGSGSGADQYGSGGPGGANESGAQAAESADGTAGGGGGGAPAGVAFVNNTGGSGTAPSSGGLGGGGGGGAFGGVGGFGAGGGGSNGGWDSSARGGVGGFGGGGGGGSWGTAAGGFGAGDGTSTAQAFGGGGGGAGLGGAVFNNGGTVSIVNCTLTGNTALGGAGGSSTQSGTVAGGDGSGLGGTVFNRNGTVTITNDTFAGNRADQGGADVYNLGDGSGQTGSVGLTNDVLAAPVNGVADYQDNTSNGGGTSSRGSNDLIALPGSFAGTSSAADPLLAPLGNYGGPTQTFALLPGSAALGAGTGSGTPATDQRGVSRAGAVDVGAFQSRGFTLTVTGGDNQQALVNTAFASPLAVQVTSAFAEPVQGGIVTFSGPGSGAGATFPDGTTVTLDAGGDGGVAVAANGTTGGYQVAAATGGAAGVAFSLTNLPTLALDQTTVPDGTVGVSYGSQTLTATGGAGGPDTFKVTAGNVPDGLKLDPDGLLSGTPTAAGPFSFTVQATDSGGFTASQSYTGTIARGTPALTWPAPADLVYGTPLGGTQLDATADVAGSFSYTLADGTTSADGAVLPAGQDQTLKVTFTPTDTTDYTDASGSTTIDVNPATPTLTWPTPAAIVYGTPLDGTQLDATANVPGTFSYNAAPGTILGVGTQTLFVTFTPADAADYRGSSTSVQLDVLLPVPALRAAFVGDPPPGGLALGPVVVFNDLVFFGRKAFQLRDRHGHNVRLQLEVFYLPTGQTVVVLGGLNWHDLAAGKFVLTIDGRQVFDGFGRGPLGGTTKVRFFPLVGGLDAGSLLAGTRDGCLTTAARAR